MEIYLKEVLGFTNEKDNKEKLLSCNENFINSKSKKVGQESINILKNNNYHNCADIEAIHCYPYATRNFTRYMPEAVNNSLESWTNPYNIPLIKYHNDYDGEIVGRIFKAEYKHDDTLSGTPCLLLSAVTTDYCGSQKIENGEYLTVSIGVRCTDVRCSICGKHIYDEDCTHDRGCEYDGEICYWDIYKMEAKELSYVIVPSDKYAQNIRVYESSTLNQKSCKSNNSILMIANKEGDNKNMQDKDKIIQLEEDLKTLKTKEAETQIKFSDLEKNCTKIKHEKEELEKKLEISENEKNISEENFKEEKAIRLIAEEQLEKLSDSLKENSAETIRLYRSILDKKEIPQKDLIARTQESLVDTIQDLKIEYDSFLEKKDTNSNILDMKNKVFSEGLEKDDKDNNVNKDNNEDTKEKENKHIDIKDTLKNIFA